MSVPASIAQNTNQGERIDCHSDIHGKPQRIHTKKIKHRTHIYRLRQYKDINEYQNYTRGNQRQEESLQRNPLPTSKVIDEDKSWNCQKIQDVNSDREPHQVSNQDHPTQVMRLIRLIIPTKHQPHHKSRKHG